MERSRTARYQPTKQTNWQKSELLCTLTDKSKNRSVQWLIKVKTSLSADQKNVRNALYTDWQK